MAAGKLKFSVCVVEDDSTMQKAIQKALQRYSDLNCKFFADGESAWTAFEKTKFDLIILDGNMPHMNGLEVAHALRSAGRPAPPIIFLSAKTDAADIDEFLKNGAGYIAKPFDPQTICARIDEIIAKSPRHLPRSPG